ncbi:MAG: aromatic aminobenezylarsenical efflux permease ArsG family transporter [Thermogutta sp.]|nr:aromatic aminobenezylarsenical efflux permease ArsG family transporter [Thermogutta sp.]HPU06147.1 aromatic aminobenezylarsenical efflux permease ArsG family transporter [Thermogutta sp.]HQF12660.1 aromatic aminobenezylarsenical efflux permease ArsG family transporter [Thermogutta sp.]
MDSTSFTQQIPALVVTGLGLATAVAPCPLATNIAALSYIGRKVVDRRWVLLSGILYTAGRSFTYFALAAVLVTGLTNLPGLAMTLQYYGHLFLGPILILIGMMLLGLIVIPLPGAKSEQAQALADRYGLIGALLIGVLFALAFCPTSAAYFGAVVTILTGKSAGALWLALLYGVATGLPVFVFAVLIAMGVQWMGKAFQVLTAIDHIVRTATGVIFIVVGIYFILLYDFNLPINIYELLR